MFACAAAASVCGQAVPGRSGGVVELQQAVEDASHDWLVLLVAAHPDDDYLLAAASLRFDYGFSVAVLLATRGEGGQNSEGPETGDALGRIRTLEAEASAADLDIDVWYLNRPDGGYCRSSAEALDLWGREGTQREMVRLIRRIRPDIVLTNHHAGEAHGNDQAVFDLLPGAVAAAGDPEYDAGGESPFEVGRLFTGVVGGAGTADPIIELDLDAVDFARGATYRRLAYDALTANHKSQQPFRPLEELYPAKLQFGAVALGDGPAPHGLYEDLPTLWNLLPEALPDGTGRSDLVRALDVDLKRALGNTSTLVERALAIHARLQRIERTPGSELDVRVARRLAALGRVIRYGCALQVRVLPGSGVAVPGEVLPLRLTIHNGEARAIEDLRVEVLGGGDLHANGSGSVLSGIDLATRDRRTIDCAYRVPESWAGRGNPMRGLFSESRFRWPVRLDVRYRIDGQEFSFPLEVPVEVRPPVEVICAPRRLLVPAGLRVLRFSLEVRRNSRTPVAGELAVEGPAGLFFRGETGNRVSVSLGLERAQTFDFELEVPDTLPVGVSLLRIRFGGAVLNEVMLHRVDVAIDPSLRVGLVRGVERSTEEALQGLGVHLTLLTDEALLIGDLGDLDTVVVDLRALRGRPRVRAAFGRLLRFAAAGGRLLVFYHKDSEFNLEDAGFRGYPYDPFHIGRGRVTREDAPVELLVPEHPILRHPNRIGPQDWDGWVHERGLYFPDRWGPEYRPLLSMADPEQAEERGSLLHAPYGRGDYVYCALSLYRQLKNLHPGALRLFANMLTRG